MQKIDIFGIMLTDCSLKESLALADEYIKNGAMNTFMYITTPVLILAGKDETEKERLEAVDLILCGDADILRVAKIDSKSRLYETENLIFMKEFLRRLVKTGKPIYLIGESEEMVSELRKELEAFQKGLNIAGSSVADSDTVDMETTINSINDIAPIAVISRTGPGIQEKWMSDTKPFVNTEVWLGIPKDMKITEKKDSLRKKALNKIYKKVFQRKMNRYNGENEKGEETALK